MNYLGDKINLRGNWNFSLDPESKGEGQKWFKYQLEDTVTLPGTTDEFKRGYCNIGDQNQWILTRKYKYIGKCWYQKDFVVTYEMLNRDLFLYLERTKISKVWIDDDYIGTYDSLTTPHLFKLGKLSLGNHRLTIMIDNDINTPAKHGHQLTDNTQTNWNGILGKIEIFICNKVFFEQVKVTPVLKDAKIDVDITINNLSNDVIKENIYLNVTGNLEYDIELNPGINKVKLEYKMDNFNYWSEFTPNIYNLYIDCLGNIVETVFGMREFKAKGTQFTINGLKTFLRGKHDACVFPLTGYAPMEVNEWIRVFEIAKSYGINHYRFHTWCPPKAAFCAADIVGIYLQPELSLFSGNYEEGSNVEFIEFLLNEGLRICKEYGNHPSFVMFALGNEVNNSQKVLGELVRKLRENDNRLLYAQGSNNNHWGPKPFEGDDYWTIMRTKWKGSNVRASFAHCDMPLGHVQDKIIPSTSIDFSESIKDFNFPIIGHETGQYQVYPNYDEINKYTGVLKPNNLEIFKSKLIEQGMFDQANDFFKASGALSVLCYREEVEAAIRTEGFGGFQLLDIQDFPGQGTALVGILDAFMDSKGLIKPEEWREFCDKTVILMLYNKYIFASGELFNADIKIAHYGESNLNNINIEVKLLNEDSKTIEKFELINYDVEQGSTVTVTNISCKLPNVTKSNKCIFEIKIKETNVINHYPIWIYPNDIVIPQTKIFTSINEELLGSLNNGESVILFPNEIKNSLEGFFASDFWCFPMFENICKNNNAPISPGTLGILCDPNHKLFNDFMTEYHSNYQWWNIVMNSRPIILDNTPKSYRPIVQVIDNCARCHKLGLVFEFKVGSGKLLICSSDLLNNQDKLEVKQFLYSITNYVNSEGFNPTTEISVTELIQLI